MDLADITLSHGDTVQVLHLSAVITAQFTRHNEQHATARHAVGYGRGRKPYLHDLLAALNRAPGAVGAVTVVG